MVDVVVLAGVVVIDVVVVVDAVLALVASRYSTDAINPMVMSARRMRCRLMSGRIRR